MRTLRVAVGIIALGIAAAACGSSDPAVVDVLLLGTGFQAQAFSPIRASIGGDVKTGTISSNGVFVVGTWVDLERGASYQIDYYADIDSNGTCEAGADPSWRFDVAALTVSTNSNAVFIPLSGSATQVPAACDSF